jgi:hypothetical protein
MGLYSEKILLALWLVRYSGYLEGETAPKSLKPYTRTT